MKSAFAYFFSALLTCSVHAQPPQNKSPKTGTATKAAFDVLTFGMSLSQVEKLVGGKGVVVGSGRVAPGQNGITYEWAGKEMFSTLTCKFQDGKLIAKMANGLDH